MSNIIVNFGNTKINNMVIGNNITCTNFFQSSTEKKTICKCFYCKSEKVKGEKCENCGAKKDESK